MKVQCRFCKKECIRDKVGNLMDSMGFALMSHAMFCMPYRKSKEGKLRENEVLK